MNNASGWPGWRRHEGRGGSIALPWKFSFTTSGSISRKFPEAISTAFRARTEGAPWYPAARDSARSRLDSSATWLRQAKAFAISAANPARRVESHAIIATLNPPLISRRVI
jgi:hypothetical protein